MNFYANILEAKENTVIGDEYFYQTKEEIENWLKNTGLEKGGITNYSINKDLTVDVKGDVKLSFQKLTKIPIKFNNVKGNFSCGSNKLTSLKGCPETVGGYFSCDNNKLKSLEYCPKTIGRDIDCQNNAITSLKGIQSEINGYLNCSYNKLTSLEYCPKIIKGYFNCTENQLKSFDNLPTVKEYINLPYAAPIKSLKGIETSKNMSAVFLCNLYKKGYDKLFKDIKFDKIKNLDDIIADLHKINDSDDSDDNSYTAHMILKFLEDSQSY